ncbi:MAG TPA: IclR family transcriptional regulator C-terminal domain-containing protein, partial [Chloroflexota bacterium]|nr:IclR family transcriptional regulator C-terminal domain-containing protein [Chloroflexota bacterium]
IRVRGWAHDDEEASEGLQCVASPINNARGECVAAISIAAPSQRMSEWRLEQLGSVVVQASLEISGLLGYRPAAAVQQDSSVPRPYRLHPIRDNGMTGKSDHPPPDS